jgi:hypothetical protein
VEDGARDDDLLLHAGRVGAGALVEDAAEVEQVVELRHAAVDVGALHLVEAAEVVEDLAAAQAVVEPHPAVDDADRAADGLACAGDVVAGHRGLAGVARSRVARMRRWWSCRRRSAEQAEHLTGGDVEGDVVDGDEPVEAFGETANVDHGARVPRPRRPR